MDALGQQPGFRALGAGQQDGVFGLAEQPGLLHRPGHHGRAVVDVVKGALGQVPGQQHPILHRRVQLNGPVYPVAGKDCAVNAAAFQLDGGQNRHHGLRPDVKERGIVGAVFQHVFHHLPLQAREHLPQGPALERFEAGFQVPQDNVVALGHKAGPADLNVSVGGVVEQRVNLGVGPLVVFVGLQGNLCVSDGILEGIVTEIQKQAGGPGLLGHFHRPVPSDDHIGVGIQGLTIDLFVLFFGAVDMDFQIDVEQQIAAAGVAEHILDHHQRHTGAGLVGELARFAQQHTDSLGGQPDADHRHIQADRIRSACSPRAIRITAPRRMDTLR